MGGGGWVRGCYTSPAKMKARPEGEHVDEWVEVEGHLLGAQGTRREGKKQKKKKKRRRRKKEERVGLEREGEKAGEWEGRREQAEEAGALWATLGPRDPATGVQKGHTVLS